MEKKAAAEKKTEEDKEAKQETETGSRKGKKETEKEMEKETSEECGISQVMLYFTTKLNLSLQKLQISNRKTVLKYDKHYWLRVW